MDLSKRCRIDLRLLELSYVTRQLVFEMSYFVIPRFDEQAGGWGW
jgi:hypothetical protein